MPVRSTSYKGGSKNLGSFLGVLVVCKGMLAPGSLYMLPWKGNKVPRSDLGNPGFCWGRWCWERMLSGCPQPQTTCTGKCFVLFILRGGNQNRQVLNPKA